MTRERYERKRSRRAFETFVAIAEGNRHKSFGGLGMLMAVARSRKRDKSKQRRVTKQARRARRTQRKGGANG